MDRLIWLNALTKINIYIFLLNHH